MASGQRLGAVGVSGRRSAEASHLHFGVRDAGSQRYHDPLSLLPPLATAPETRPQAPPAGLPLPAGPIPVSAPRRVPRAPRVPAAAPRRVPAATPRRRPLTALRPRPATDRRRVPAAEPRRVPAAPPRRASATEPRPHPAAVPRGLPLSSPRTQPAARPRRLQADEPRRRPEGHRLHGSAQAPGRAQAHEPPADAVAHPGRDRRSGGPDAGWALACLGLLAAAALVGTSGGGRTAARRGRTAVQRVLGPLTGRA